jgi:uncharacterized protein YlaI
MKNEEQDIKAINKIKEHTNLTDKEIEKQIESKIKEFSGLLSKTGAIYIVAKENGINLIKNSNKELKIESLEPNMNNINIKGKIINISNIRTFKRNGKEGKVVNITIADDTSSLRLSLWNEDVEKINDIKINEFYELKNCYTKKDNLGLSELRLTKKSTIKKTEDIDFKVISKQNNNIKKPNKYSFKNIKEGDIIETKITITKIIQRDILYYLCPTCKKRVENNTCKTHNKVEPEPLLVLNAIIEDNFNEINAVFFKEQVEKILNKTTNEIEKLIKNNKLTNYINNNILGTEYKLNGLIKKNNFTQNIELLTTEVTQINIVKEIDLILNEIKGEV